MAQHRVRAVYMRGGTSRCLAFHARDLPSPGPERDHILLSALGSPDPYGRQLDGLGGGMSSLSKAFIIGAPTHPDAQVDYTFAQIEVDRSVVDYTGNCGNCSSAVGPFAIDERLVPSADGETAVRIHNTNTKKIIVARVPVTDGEAAVLGDFALPGVAGLGARIALDFLDPGGSRTGRLLPSGRARELIAGVEASMVDATNPMVFVRAKDLGLTGTETPQAMDGAEEQQLHRALAAAHDHADLLVLEPAFELEEHRLALVEGQLLHRFVELIALLPAQPEPLGIVLAAPRDRVGQLDPGRPAPPLRHQIRCDLVEPC